MKKARIISKFGRMTANGRERIMQLRAGAKGRGKLILSVIYWPWSQPSCDSADEIIFSAARSSGVELVRD